MCLEGLGVGCRARRVKSKRRKGSGGDLQESRVFCGRAASNAAATATALFGTSPSGTNLLWRRIMKGRRGGLDVHSFALLVERNLPAVAGDAGAAGGLLSMSTLSRSPLFSAHSLANRQSCCASRHHNGLRRPNSGGYRWAYAGWGALRSIDDATLISSSPFRLRMRCGVGARRCF